MIRIAVLSRSDTFHRQIWNAAKERTSVRVELRLRSFHEPGRLRDIDVLVVHDHAHAFPSPADPQWIELPPVVFVGCGASPATGNTTGEPRSFVAEGVGAERILVAAEATAHGLVITDPECLAPERRSPLPSASPGKAIPLTERELEVLALVATGKTNQQIADALGVTSNTVKYHLAGIYGALDVNTRAEAVVAAIRGGFISM